MTTKLLKGRKILVTAYDLEQSEHRGIAVYSKSLMQWLHEAGAEVCYSPNFLTNSQKDCETCPRKHRR